jgi:hypothetical protein
VKQLDELRAVTKCRVVPNVAGRSAIARAIARFYEDSAELADADTNFKVVDAQGRTVVKSIKDLEANGAAAAAVPRPAPPPPAPARPSGEVAALRNTASGGGSPAELLKAVEEVQRKEVAALRAMVELLIEKGIFSREEYLAKVRK